MDISSTDRLVGVREKISRAGEHVAELEKLITILGFNRPFFVEAPESQSTGLRILRAPKLPAIPPRISCIVGDAVRNLRSAQDHLAWKLVEANGGTPTTSTEFPIYSKAPSRKSRYGKNVAGMSPAATALIESLQPYRGGNDGVLMLNQLDIIDKHRLMIMCGMASRNVLIIPAMSKRRLAFLKAAYGIDMPSYDPDRGFPVGPEDRLQILDEGVAIGGIGPSPGGSDAADEVRLSIILAFAAPEEVRGKPVVPFLRHLLNLVETTSTQFLPHL